MGQQPKTNTDVEDPNQILQVSIMKKQNLETWMCRPIFEKK